MGAIDELHLGAEAAEHAGEFDGNVAAAGDDDVTGEGGHVEGFIGDDGVLGALKIRGRGAAADGDDDVLGGDGLAADLD